MRRTRTQATHWTRIATVVAALAISACSTLAPQPEKTPADETPEIVTEALVEAAPSPAPKQIIPPPPTGLPPVAIVLTSSRPAYADVAQELTRLFEDYVLYNLDDDRRPPVSVLRLINDSESRAVLAIGLRAAKSSVAMAGVPVIFSQVFNHQDHDLLRENTRGVAAVPPLDAQLANWKRMDPSLARIGVIIGAGHDDLVAAATLAAERQGIDLQVRVAHSDQETLYIFKRMVRNIDGYWLFPDNRILSARVLQQMLDEANRQNIAVAAPTESMLKIGADISFSTVAADIARTIADIARQIDEGRLEQVEPITALAEIHVATREKPAKDAAVAKVANEDADR